LLVLTFDPDDGGIRFLRNVSIVISKKKIIFITTARNLENILRASEHKMLR
jgi:response regulator of citrate/malate metabolism